MTIRTYIDTCNEQPKPFIWTKTADEILAEHRPILSAHFRDKTLGDGHGN